MKNNISALLNEKETVFLSKQKYKKGEIIYHEGDLCSTVSIINNGLVDIVSYSFNGRELIYNSLSDGEIFGINLLFSANPYYKGNVVAKEDTEIISIYKNNLVHLLQTNEKFLIKYLEIQSNFAKKLNSTIKLLSYDNALERFEYYLYINNGSVSYKSITDLADKLHLKRETLSRLISDLEKRRQIRRLNKVIYKIN